MSIIRWDPPASKSRQGRIQQNNSPNAMDWQQEQQQRDSEELEAVGEQKTRIGGWNDAYIANSELGCDHRGTKSPTATWIAKEGNARRSLLGSQVASQQITTGNGDSNDAQLSSRGSEEIGLRVITPPKDSSSHSLPTLHQEGKAASAVQLFRSPAPGLQQLPHVVPGTPNLSYVAPSTTETSTSGCTASTCSPSMTQSKDERKDHGLIEHEVLSVEGDCADPSAIQTEYINIDNLAFCLTVPGGETIDHASPPHSTPQHSGDRAVPVTRTAVEQSLRTILELNVGHNGLQNSSGVADSPSPATHNARSPRVLNENMMMEVDKEAPQIHTNEITFPSQRLMVQSNDFAEPSDGSNSPTLGTYINASNGTVVGTSTESGKLVDTQSLIMGPLDAFNPTRSDADMEDSTIEESTNGLHRTKNLNISSSNVDSPLSSAPPSPRSTLISLVYSPEDNEDPPPTAYVTGNQGREAPNFKMHQQPPANSPNRPVSNVSKREKNTKDISKPKAERTKRLRLVGHAEHGEEIDEHEAHYCHIRDFDWTRYKAPRAATVIVSQTSQDAPRLSTQKKVVTQAAFVSAVSFPPMLTLIVMPTAQTAG
ncbi:hypothetical protein BDV98DRAFT_583180 [Pterulicium gracile]|uniref:Uncharacterized protein n=1 Tax=Pterulicium gracile TaxID=1884261 RepID=A0A5C3QGG4_9AGAR|nr:hypothetical protein BDV98DRAFT_583180 [Pterula gracilis]